MISPIPEPEAFNGKKTLEWPGNHVFFIKVNEYFETIRTQYENVLSAFECKKADSFFRAKDRESYIVRKHVLRYLLSILMVKEAHTIQFNTIANKKPYVEGVPFNASHSGNLIAIALSGTTVGIDIELIRDDFSYQNMLTDIFSIAEQITIQKSANSLSGFYTLWTRKEAVLKACGMGLYNDDLKALDVLLPVSSYAGQSYRISSYIAFDNYVMSTAWSSETEKIYYWTL